MSQSTLAHEEVSVTQGDEHSHGGSLLGPFLCWAVVFADIGTSVYYVPGVLYGNVGKLAGFFVMLTMSVFILLTLKYSEVTHRFPQGGGVVTVAASAMNKWIGALGGMFILVDYFLTASISSLSGIQYLSVVLPSIGASMILPLIGAIQLPQLLITLGVLVLLGILNWVGINESAKVSLVGAVIAFISDLLILGTVFTHISFATFLSLFPAMFANEKLTTVSLLTGFAGSFLAFSGLESISQLSPVMKTPRKKVAGIALLFVVLTIGITSPLLTMFSTLLLPHEVGNSILQAQLISLLGGHWGNYALQIEVAISASALLVFASNTAIIGSYHVFIALARLGFFPTFILKRNTIRNTPHYSIILATVIPMFILVVVLGNINILADMYAFGLLGAFTLTCLGLDIVRARDRKSARLLRAKQISRDIADQNLTNGTLGAPATDLLKSANARSVSLGITLKGVWSTIDFWLGILTTVLVMVAWSTNLVAKPLATAFGGSVTVIGMGISFFNYRREKARGQVPVHIVPLSNVEILTDAVVAVLLPGQEKSNLTVMQLAAQHVDKQPLAFLYIGNPKDAPQLSPFEYYEPYLYDKAALETFRKTEAYVHTTRPEVVPQFLYRPLSVVSASQEAEIVTNIWRIIHPHELLIAAKDVAMLEGINPDRIRYESTPNGKVAHLFSKW